MPIIEQLGMQAAQGATGGILGLALGGLQNQQQLHQQQRLQQLQIEGNKQMIDYNMSKQMQMWHDTNYGAQVKELEAAGLNPALLYGQGGGGGTTTGNTSTNVTQGQATKGGNQLAEIGMGMQLQLLQAQKENIQADTENKKAENPNIPVAGAKMQAETALTKSQTDLANLDVKFYQQTFDTRIQEIDRKVELIAQEARSIDQNTGITADTRDATVSKMQAEAVGAILQNILIGAKTNATQQEITESKARVSKMTQDVMQGWQQLSLNEKRMKVEGVMNEFSTMTKNTVTIISPKVIKQIAAQIDEILDIRKSDFK